LKFFIYRAAMQIAKSLSATKNLFFATIENYRAAQIPFKFYNDKLSNSKYCFSETSFKKIISLYAVFGKSIFSGSRLLHIKHIYN